MPAFGLVIDACALPEFSGVSLSTRPAKMSSRMPTVERSQSVQRVVVSVQMPTLPSCTRSSRTVESSRTLLRLEQADMDVVIAALHADAGLRLQAAKAPVEGMPRIETAEGAAVELVELVAIDGIVEEVGEIVVELQVGAHDIGAEIALAVFARMRKIAGQAEAAGDAAVGRIERAETADDALVDGALRDLIGRVPGVGISHRRQRQPVGRGALAVAHHAVELADIVRHVPRAVIFDALDGGEQRARPNRGRAGGQPAMIAETAKGHLGDVFGQLVEVVDLDGAGGAEVAHIGVVRTLADIHRLDQLRDHES